MDDVERRIRQRLKNDFTHYAKKCLKIRSKSGEIHPFVINKAQQYIHDRVEQQRREQHKIRAIICKGRQQGCSTYIEGRFYWLVTHRFGLRAFILTHDNDATNNLFEMAQRYHEHCPTVVRPTIEASNAKELIFAGLDSGYKLGTAGNKSVGRSSTVQLLHGSEVAYWPNAQEHAKGILQAVPNEPGTEVFIESTANGIGNYFHEQWQMAEAGESHFIPIFIPWFWQDEYSLFAAQEFKATEEEEELKRLYGLKDGQLMWRRNKIVELSVGGLDGLKAFMQEYPCTPTEAFQMTGEDNFMAPNLVMNARKCEAEGVGSLIIGVDPAWQGDDRTSIIYRRGRKAYNLQSYHKKNTMEVVGIVNRIIEHDNPVKVCIDIGGIGAGVYDRLVELGHGDIVVAVNGGSTALDQIKFGNKRAEMWGLMREWLCEYPCQIPDVDSLHSDLCSIKCHYDSNSRLMMERKEAMRKRHIRSPDEADALSLTFAVPAKSLIATANKKYQTIGSNILMAHNNIDRLKKAAYVK